MRAQLKEKESDIHRHVIESTDEIDKLKKDYQNAIQERDEFA